METRTYVLSTRSKLAALLLGVVALGLVAVLLTVGFTVLVALVILGTLAGLIAVARRAVGARLDRARGRVPDHIELDPAKQVFPPDPTSTGNMFETGKRTERAP